MCLAIPGKVIDIKNDDVVVEYPGEKRSAKNFGLSIKKGDYVLVQAKVVVQKVPKKEALESIRAWKNLEDGVS
ncbi:MAG: HypC/HybG/HupF family hydrogenase formation chaperone [Candidatus Woesearchaeota archaeon]|nr:HypC/HybG/HupF family hydrogenase formation chaperone [Candidatus Woesearchaeota archaeon]